MFFSNYSKGKIITLDLKSLGHQGFEYFHKNEGKGILYDSLGFLAEENLTHLFTCNDRIKIITAYKFFRFKIRASPLL